MKTQNKPVQFNSILRTCLVLTALTLSRGGQVSYAGSYEAIQTLAQGGAFPVNGLAGYAIADPAQPKRRITL